MEVGTKSIYNFTNGCSFWMMIILLKWLVCKPTYKFSCFDFQGPTILGRTKLSNAMMRVKMTNYLRKVLAVVVDGLTGTFC